MAKFTCPFCIREYDKKKVLYFCPDCGTVATPGLFAHTPIKCKTPNCGGYATVRKCPYCEEVIPKVALETPNLPFSIIGVSNSGKTNYITVMLKELGRSSGLNLALGHQTIDTINQQNKNCSLIYDQHKTPDNTNSGKPLPQIWYIKNLQKKHGNEVPTYTFTIFDGAGEDHENQLDPTSTVCRYINASKAIILTVDPLILPGIQSGIDVDTNIMANSLGTGSGGTVNAEEIIHSIANYIKSARGLDSSKMLDIPIAVVFTKFDTILNHRAFGPQALIKNPSMTVRNGTIDLAEIQQIDSEIRYWLNQIGENKFISALDSHFKEYYLFGVSSYGSPPKIAHTTPNEIKPHRVLDPILWLFKRAKFID